MVSHVTICVAMPAAGKSVGLRPVIVAADMDKYTASTLDSIPLSRHRSSDELSTTTRSRYVVYST
eukprot:CAMPEP_0117536706 /NCGR_PEP_ID=MMETSP0784-20121206/41590_1 /TAXON_ID=39447 /ORGANISM="" /LENGTH=64 /DNA_ID=CAMNT_0005333275 /DNA_START=264 /DNA_END=458 /DNA_ORIENTATION=-